MEESVVKTAFPTYPEYKDSEEDWMGEIPNHWITKKLKHIFAEKKISHNPNLSCGAISFGEVITKDDDKIPESTKASYQEVLEGEFLVNPLNLNYDLKSLRIALSTINVVVSSGYIVLKDLGKIDKQYYKYLLHRYDVAYMKLLGSGVRQTINFNHISNSLLAFPPLPEQTAIAHFLDEKTAKIDQAIAQKEKMIELLKERKQIMIQNAVTKGLDPNVKLVDSGVEWIGEIPEHWEVYKFKQLFHEKRKITNVNLRAGAISYGIVKYKSENSILESTKESYQEVLRGEFLINPLNLNYDLVSLRIALSSIDVVVSSGYIVLKESRSLDKNYMKWLLHRFDISWMKLLGSGVRQTLSFSHLSGELLILPPKEEQERIASWIEVKTNEISASISLEESLIQKLKEYKATLIDSAVTGKIKVC